MKRLIYLLLFCSVLFSGCAVTEKPIPPTSDSQPVFGEMLEKRPVRMMKISEDLYYDSGLVSEEIPRCGTLDGALKKTVPDNQIPQNSGEANFEAEGYQHATGITKEVNIDGQWHIFKKYDTYGKPTGGLTYCYYIKGHLNNATSDSEIIVLSEAEDVTFNDVYAPLLSSQVVSTNNWKKTMHNPILKDRWGVSFRAGQVNSTGFTLEIEQFGGAYSGELQTGAAYTLETTVNDEWQPVATKNGEEPVWHMVAYPIKKNDISYLEIDWETIYGELDSGFYRLKKEVMDLKAPGEFDTDCYEVYFTIE